MNERKPSRRTRGDAGQSVRGIYVAGGVAGILFVVLLISALIIDFIAPPPVHGGRETLEFIAENKTLYIAEQILWILPSILPVVVFVALYIALAPLSRSWALLAAVVGGLPWALLLAVPVSSRGSLSLVYLSDRYSVAGSEGERGVFAAAAEALIAENNTPAIAGLLSPVGIFLISLVMLKGVLPRSVAWLGLLTGALGVLSEALRFVAPTFYWGYGVLLWAWFISIGISLIRLHPEAPVLSGTVPEKIS
ncbi:DUF4386 family protein [Pseudarthrobacter sp. NPDC058362]|uniref:DUF4386 family protein n=1 Tax=Pseudarthrobacter sp. NPDC058362 TaxID=3346458 RepID=UPI00365E23F0